MTTSPSTPVNAAPPRVPLRLHLRDPSPQELVGGVWWPQSRDLQTEAADLIDHFPPSGGYVNRLLYSRPDWDDAVTEGRGVRRIQARRGPVKTGSFPHDDTHLMVLLLATGRHLRLRVIPSDATTAQVAAQFDDAAPGSDHPDWAPAHAGGRGADREQGEQP